MSGNYLLRDADCGPREFRDPEENGDLHEILEELWLRVVKSILDALSYSVGFMLIHNIKSRPFSHFPNYSRIHCIQLGSGGAPPVPLHSFRSMQLVSTHKMHHLDHAFPTMRFRHILLPSAHF